MKDRALIFFLFFLAFAWWGYSKMMEHGRFQVIHVHQGIIGILDTVTGSVRPCIWAGSSFQCDSPSKEFWEK